VRGRKPKPIALKELAGTVRADRVNATEPRFRIPERMLRPPTWLGREAASVWSDLGHLLLNAGLFTVVDRYALAMFCVAAGRWIEAERAVAESGGPVLVAESGSLYQNPWLHVANRAWGQMKKMLSEFGLTPAERSRLKAAVVADEPSLAEMLFQMSEVHEVQGDA